MFNSELKKFTMLFSAAALWFTTGAVVAAENVDTPTAVSSISSDDLEKVPAGSRDVASMLKLLPELTTTARRSTESVLDVPLAISVLSSDEIKEAQIVNLSDVASMTPGFSFQNYFGQNFSVPTIRGVSQIDIFGDPNAPVYIDGIYVPSKSGINFSFLDVERIEVLRGPQPAYFGYNAFSGAVNFVTARPSDEPEINGELTVGSDEKSRVSLSLSGPLVGDVLSGRAAVLYDDFGGTYENSGPLGKDIGGAKYKTFSGSLFLTPNDYFSALLNVYVSQDSIDPPAMNNVAANCEPSLDVEDPAFPNDPPDTDRMLNFCGNIPSVGKNSLATIPGETGEDRNVWRVSLNMDLDIGVGTLSSLTGYSDTRDTILAGADRGDGNTVFAYQTNVPGFIPGSFNLSTFEIPLLQASAGNDKLKDFSQELRYSSPEENRARVTVGAYYRSTEELSPIPAADLFAPESQIPADIATFDLGFPGSPVFFELCPCIPFGPPGSPGISAGFGGFIYDDFFAAAPPGLAYTNKTETDLWAGFFALAFDFTDQVTAYAEGRYTDYTQHETDNNPTTAPADRKTRFTDDFFNWRASLEFHPNEVTTYYGSVATGIKQGGLNTFTPDTVDPDPDCVPTPGPNCVDQSTFVLEFGQEEITTYELGYKSAYRGGDLVVDSAVYYSDWKKIVLPSIVDSVGGKAIIPIGVADNLGNGSIKGFETSVRVNANEMVSVGANLSYTKAEFDKGNVESFNEFPSFAPNGDMSGQDLLRQPEWQANVNLTAREQLNATWDWFARTDVNYQSSWYVGLPNEARVPGRIRTNLRFGVDNDKYTVEFWVKNLFDDDTVDAAFRDVFLANALPDGTNNFGTNFPWRLSVSHPDRRTMGLTVRGRF